MRTSLLVLLAVVVLGGGGAAWYVLGAGSSETSVDVEDVVGPPTGDEPTQDDGEAGEEPTGEPGAEDASDAATSSGDVAVTYTVDQEASTVAYELDEVLRGEDVRVVGETSEVATSVVLDPADPSTLAFGDVAVNARTLRSDSGNRDNAVRGRILQTDDPANELITFAPTGTSALPDDVGEAFTVDVTGELTIAGTTRAATFPLTVTPEADGFRVEGATTVQRSAYGLQIPSVPFVADVADDVLLRIDLLLVPA